MKYVLLDILKRFGVVLLAVILIAVVSVCGVFVLNGFIFPSAK